MGRRVGQGRPGTLTPGIVLPWLVVSVPQGMLKKGSPGPRKGWVSEPQKF